LVRTEHARELGLTGLRGWLAAPQAEIGPRATDRLNLSG